MVALTLVDHIMMQKAQCELFPNLDEDIPNPLGKTAERVTPRSKEDVQHVSQRVDEE